MQQQVSPRLAPPWTGTAQTKEGSQTGRTYSLSNTKGKNEGQEEKIW